MSKKVLGRGLEALIPQIVKDAPGENGVQLIPVDAIRANPHQPRKHFNPEKIQSLSDSIRQDGVLQPVVVRRQAGGYQLIMGERRLQAARLAGVATIPAVIRQAEDVDALRLALVENLQREDLDPIEIAEAYRALLESFGLSQQELADLIGKDRSSVANTMRLLSLPEEIRDLITAGKLSEGHARALLSLPTRTEQMAMARRIIDNALNVRQVEQETASRRPGRPRRSVKEKAPHVRQLENAISSHLGTRVSIEERRGGRGRMVIEFYSHEEFERLSEKMRIPLPR